MTHDNEQGANPAEEQSPDGHRDLPRHAADDLGSGNDPRTSGTGPSDRMPEADAAGEGAFIQAVGTPRRRVGSAFVAWLVIIALVYLIIAMRQLPEEATEEPFDGAELLILEVQAKYLVGASELPTVGSGDLAASASEMNSGPLANRLCYVVMLGELDSPKAASEALVRLDEQIEEAQYVPPAELAEALDALRSVYDNYEEELWQAPSLDEAGRQMLVDRLGWFGELALAPAEGPDPNHRESVLRPARRTLIVFMLAMMGGTLVLLGGIFSFLAFVALVSTDRIRSSLGRTVSDGNVYAETFALWMVLFAVLSILAAGIAGDDGSLLAPLAAMILSLSALVWPMVRGITPEQMRRDVGLTTGRGRFVEPLWGLVCYASTLPLMLLGVIITFALTRLPVFGGGAMPADEFGPTNVPSHPLIQWVADAGWWGAVQIILVACVAAPLVEEIMFRGVLYRHLREATVRMRVGWSVAASTLLNAFVFAIIHPQGLLALPPLMALAIGFSLAREWRGSLLASMTAHAVNNGVVTLMLLSIS